jgi:hypothetical protein
LNSVDIDYSVARKICKADTISSSLELLVRKEEELPVKLLRTKGICCFCFCFSAGTKETGKSLRLVGVGEIRGPGLQGAQGTGRLVVLELS